MKRRLLITALILFAVAGSFIIFTGFYAPKSKNIGLQLYSIRDSIRRDVPAAIEKVAKMGYKFVEPAGYNNGKIYGMDPADFRELCKKNGITVISTHVGSQLPTAENWDKQMAWWDQCIDAHKAAGAKFIVQPSMGGDAYKSLDNLKKWCEYFNAVGEKCNAKGLRFGYHNHSQEFKTLYEGKPLYDWMLELTDPKKVMFQIDLYWCVEGGKDPVDYFNRYPGRFELWHIKDEKEIGASGKMNFEAIWQGLKKSGMKYGIVEVERYSFDQFTSCQKSIEFLNNAPYVKLPK